MKEWLFSALSALKDKSFHINSCQTAKTFEENLAKVLLV